MNFELIPKLPGWARGEIRGDAAELQTRAMELNRNRRKNRYFVCALLPSDSEVCLYRVETTDPLEIARRCEVGTHGELSYSDPRIRKRVLDELARIHAKNPIVPFYADMASFQCTFEKPITDEFAAFLDEILTQGVEAYAAEDGLVGPSVKREGCLSLWWD